MLRNKEENTMLKIFKTYGNMIVWWFIFSAVNYKWPVDGKYTSWNLFTIDSNHFWRIFGLFAMFFIASCYGYLQGKKEFEIDKVMKVVTRGERFLKSMDKVKEKKDE